MTTLLRRLWRGEVSLAQAFWEYAIAYGLLLNLATSVAAFALFAAKAPALYGAAFFLLPVPYNLLVLVAVWRSAGRYRGPRHWADLARIAVLFWVLLASLA